MVLRAAILWVIQEGGSRGVLRHPYTLAQAVPDLPLKALRFVLHQRVFTLKAAISDLFSCPVLLCP